jgi:hypothetical protein
MRTRTISVENSGDFYPQSVLTPIIEKQRFSTALALIITRARTDRINMAPILFCLGMNINIYAGGSPIGQFIHLNRCGSRSLMILLLLAAIQLAHRLTMSSTWV